PDGGAMSANASTLLPVVVVAFVASHGSRGALNESITTRLYGPGPGTEPSGTPVGCGVKLWSAPSSGVRFPVVSANARYTNASLATRLTVRTTLPSPSAIR